MIRLGLIGLGQAAQLLHMPNIEHMDDMYKVTAVSDVSHRLMDFFQERYGVSHCFADAMDLIRCPEVDAVMILCAGDHADYAIAALEAGKHVFIEKPMSMSYENALRLKEVKDRHPDQTAMVGYCRRYNHCFLKMKELLRNDPRSISYVRARTIVLEGPWYLQNSHQEKKAIDLDPKVKEKMNAAMFRDIDRTLGGNTTKAEQLCYLLMAASGCHILSAVRELIGEPKAIRAAVISPSGMQFTLIFEYDGFNMTFEEMNDQEVVEFQEAIEVYQGNRKLSLKYDSPYIKNLPATLTVSELENGQAKITQYGPDYRDMFENELREFNDCITTGREPVCSVSDAIKDVKLYEDIVRFAIASNH